MANIPLIHLSQLAQNELGSFVDTRLLVASGEVFASITGSQIQTGSFDTRYINVTGDQIISGSKNFANRPLIFNTGVMLTGESLSPFQTGQLASSGNLQETGRNLQSQINTLSGITGTYTGVFYPRTGNPSGFTFLQVTGSNTLTIANLVNLRGARVWLDPNTIIISGDVRQTGVLSIGASGNINTGFFTGHLILSGGGNIVAFTGDIPTIHISGNTGAYNNFLTPDSTIGVSTITTSGFFPSGIVSGNIVISGAGRINIYTGVNGSIIISGLDRGVNSIGATGAINTGSFTGNVMLSGANNIIVYTGIPINNSIVISGNTGSLVGLLTVLQTGQFATSTNLAATGAIIQSQLNSRPTGNICMFDSGIQQGVTVQSFNFPILFTYPPFVFTQLKYLGNTGAGLPTIGVSGITSSGFSGVYNRAFNSTGYSLNILAMSGITDSPNSELTFLSDWWDNNPDKPLTTPSNWDDEFGYTGTLPGGDSGKWLWANQGVSTAIITGHRLRIRDIGSSNNVSALYQPISGTTTTGNPWTITTKLSLNDLTYLTFNKCGLFLSGSGSRLINWAFRAGNSNSTIQTLTYSVYNNATTFTSEILVTFMAWEKDLYLRVLNTGNVGTGLFFQYSRDGYSYINVISGASTGTSGFSEGILNVGLFTEAANASASFGEFDFFRLQTGIFF